MKIYRILVCLMMLSAFSCEREPKVDTTLTLPFFNSSSFTPEWISKTSPKYNLIHRIPDFKFINQNGDTLTQAHFRDKIYVADFFFVSCPGICPILTKNMGELQKTYKDDDDVLLLSHTVMPWRDSVPVLKEYATKNQINSDKWSLVTGNKDEIYRLAREAYFADEDFVKTKDESDFIHTENFVLIDKKGRIRGVYNGTLALDTKRLIRHIELLKKEG